MKLLKSEQTDKNTYRFTWENKNVVFYSFYIPGIQILFERLDERDTSKQDKARVTHEWRNEVRELTKKAVRDIVGGFLIPEQVDWVESSKMALLKRYEVEKKDKERKVKEKAKNKKPSSQEYLFKKERQAKQREVVYGLIEKGHSIDEMMEMTGIIRQRVSRYINEYAKEFLEC